ncbi:MAG TPA: phosphoenolpyruvate--protein phosphotransferase, partial [Gammaproteobacteria bacterium]|nr:phosphoenolpyruvate--protein phosphotransferase [Gammaproteobacteria bacterium]
MSLFLSGIGVSRGIVIGRARRLSGDQPDATEERIEREQIEPEIARYRAALERARVQLKGVRDRIPPQTTAEIAAFIDTHLLMLRDSALSDAVESLIRSRRVNAEWALKLQRDALVNVFEQMEDSYLRTRRDDVDQVVNRVQRILANQDRALAEEAGQHQDPVIVLAEDVSPADIVSLQHQGVAAFITEFGGPLSHSAILARGLNIPTVVGVRNARRLLRENELLVIDGQQGSVLAEPDQRMLAHYHRRQKAEKQHQARLARLRNQPAVTLDGIWINLRANIELPEDIEAVRRVGANGIGLYRTEFLYMNRQDVPGEEEQLEAYLRVLRSVEGAPLTIRTLDLGGDKPLAAGREGPVINNPALGLRAIRLCLKDTALFRPQLRALLRASAHGKIQIMVPMVSTLKEFLSVRQMITELQEELRREGIPFDEEIPIGVMVEVPAAALAARILARHVDFFSIGTNDLIQYTLAIDRIDDEVNYLYDPLHPAVLQLISMTIEAGREADIPVAMCGEMAGDPQYTRLLLGMGLSEFSMQPATLLEVKRIVTASET